MEPLIKSACPGWWLKASVCMDRTRHKSSAQEATWGMKSENSVRHWPYEVNVRGLGKTWAVGLMKASCSSFVTDAGNGMPAHFFRAGLGSKRSSWLGAPSMNRKITFFALAEKWGRLGSSGSGGA